MRQREEERREEERRGEERERERWREGERMRGRTYTQQTRKQREKNETPRLLRTALPFDRKEREKPDGFPTEREESFPSPPPPEEKKEVREVEREAAEGRDRPLRG